MLAEDLEPLGVFDPKATFPLKAPTIGKSCDLRFPTDDEWKERQRKIRFVNIPAGPNASRSETQGEEQASHELFQKIRIDKGEDFDEAEATKMVDALTRCDVLDSALDGGKFYARMRLIGGVEAIHILNIPSERQIRQYRRELADRVSRGRSGRIETTINLAAGERLYDAIVNGPKGYADGASIPVQHKSRAVGELIAALDDLEADDPM